MKKTISLILSFILFISLFSLSGCQKNQGKREEIKDSVIKAGFEDAYIEKDKVYLNNEEFTFISLKDYENTDVISIIRCPETNASAILNAVMPLFDDSFGNSGETVVKMLRETRNQSWDGTIYGGWCDYHGYKYSEMYSSKDDSGTIDISIGIQ